MGDILISVIVPAYNIEKYIGRCLESILHQTHKALEIIVIDDGSFDHTGELIDYYAQGDNRIIPIHKANCGVSSARMSGIERATGSYIGFVDGDDFIEPEMYEHLLNNALKYHADISHCGYQMVFPDGHIDLYYGTGKLKEQTYETALEDLMMGDFVEPGLWNKLFHRSIVIGFNESSLWDENIKINEDLLMNYLFFSRAKKAVYEDKTFYHYILRKGSAATSNEKKYKFTDPLKVISLIKEDAKKNHDLYSIVYRRYLRVLVNIASQKLWKDEADKARNSLKHELSTSDFSSFCNFLKLKLMVYSIAYFPRLYILMRKLYDTVTGMNRKYNIS